MPRARDAVVNYVEHAKSPRRRAAIIAAVIVFHAGLLYALFGRPGHAPAPREGLIRVDIVPDAKAAASGAPGASPPVRKEHP